MLILDEVAVRRFLDFRALIPAMERALRALSAGEVAQPVRVMVPVAEHGGFLGSMPAYAGAQLGAKLVTFFPNNQGVPTHHALVLLFRPETGEPLAVMDGRLITEMRTGAVSAAATKALARSDSSVLAIIGSGVQAQSHLEALRLVREFRDIRVWSPRNAGTFANRFGVRLAKSAEDAVRGADVVVIATTSRAPVLLGEWLSPGTHINAVGAPRPDWRELDDDLLRKAKLYVESREAASRESGDVIAARTIFAEIGEVIGGTKAGRESVEEITLFKSVGVAVEDLASAELVYQECLAAQSRVGAALRVTRRAMEQQAILTTLILYHEAFAENDVARRLNLLSRSMTPDAQIWGPKRVFAGYAEISDKIEGFHKNWPGCRLALTTGLNTFLNTAHLGAAIVGSDGAVRAVGRSVIEFASDGRIQRVLPLWEELPPLPVDWPAHFAPRQQPSAGSGA